MWSKDSQRMGGGAEAAGDRPARAQSAAEKSEVNYMDYLFIYWQRSSGVPFLLTSNVNVFQLCL